MFVLVEHFELEHYIPVENQPYVCGSRKVRIIFIKINLELMIVAIQTSFPYNLPFIAIFCFDMDRSNFLKGADGYFSKFSDNDTEDC